jgi:tetratricopeptide (TPR) repeat protein
MPSLFRRNAADMTESDVARRTYEQAVALHRVGRLADAETLYRKVQAIYPEHPGVLHGLGLIALGGNRGDDAIALLSRAAKAAPSNGAIRSDLGAANLRQGQYEDAAAAFGAAVRLRPRDVVALLGLGDALSVLGRVDEARAAFEALCAVDPAHAGGQFGLGNLALQLGDVTTARAHFDRALAVAPRQPKFLRALAETSRFVAGDARLATMESLARDMSKLDSEQKVELHFALAKAYDDLARYDEAFAQLAAGNAIQRQRVAYDEGAVAAFFREIAAAFSPTLMRDRAGAGDLSDKPVFVVGMPRSGSTLVEQMLASHPDVFGAGELLFMNDLVAQAPGYPSGIDALPNTGLKRLGRRYVERLSLLAPGAKRIVDKLPANFRHLGFIHLALPNAKIVHVRRDPRDICLSCYSKLFLGGLNFVYDLGELGRYYKMYDALMAHWRMVVPEGVLLDVQYESLVSDFEPQARKIIEFCGLAWDARCLAFSANQRPVRTLSQSQVRQPLFANAIGRWRHYERHLGPLLAALR